MSPRTGRPKVENPKTKRYCIRMNEEDAKKLEELAQHFGTNIPEVFRMGVERLYAETKNNVTAQSSKPTVTLSRKSQRPRTV